jgi:hypothetical protein
MGMCDFMKPQSVMALVKTKTSPNCADTVHDVHHYWLVGKHHGAQRLHNRPDPSVKL